MLRKKWIRGLVCGGGAFLLAFFSSLLSFFQILEWKSWDLRTKYLCRREEASSQIVLILIDQPSLDFYASQGVSWPWPRQMYAAVLDFLRISQAKAVILDLIFSEPSVYGVEDDFLLAEAMRRNGKTFLAAAFSRNPPVIEKADWSELMKFSLKEINDKKAAIIEANSVVLPIPKLLEAACGLGNVLFPPDDDAIFRRLPLYCRFQGKLFPSLPLSVSLYLQSENYHSPRLDDQGRMVLYFFGPSGTYKIYSIARVINSWLQIENKEIPQIQPSEFFDKIVFIASNAPGLLDLRPSPVSAVTPGVEIQATALDNLLQRKSVGFLPRFVSIVLILFFGLSVGVAVSYSTKIGMTLLFLLLGLSGPWLAAAVAFKQSFWLEIIPSEVAVITAFSLAALFNYSFEGRERRFIKNVFRHYLSPEIIEKILANPSLLRLGGEEREITSFFSDVAGFSSIAEKLTPQKLVTWLNEYLSAMTEIILEEGGTLDKYEGDAIIAFWNAPLDQPDHALKACRAAWRCQQELTRLNSELEKIGGRPVRMRIGLNSGLAVVGNMGSRRRFDYTAMGDTVNLASRLEGAAKFYGVSILLSENTLRQAQGHLIVRPVDIVQVVGKSQPVTIYELLGFQEDFPPEKLLELQIFIQAWQAYSNRNFKEAHRLFSSLPEDNLIRLYLKRCQEFINSPPPANWDGVFILKEK
ncbi:MAG: adenylate/guanylate cyclase domain-containing protein [Candidatus Aminicenantes bacterium]|nr:adenylate/guanylate cyclase domain-containing protein [Candidatus Aminicenantes bacterium]